MTTINQERKKISKMIQRDNRNNQTIDGFYQQALSIIGNHLQEFYNEYADDNGLTLNQVSQQVNSWDIQSFYQAINEMLADASPDDELSKRLQAIFAQASISRRDMLGAMIGAGMSIATAKSESFAVNELKQQYIDGYNNSSPNKISTVPAKVANQAEYSQRIWVHGDVMTTRMKETLNKGLSRGMQKSDINKMTRSIPQSGDRIDDNLATPMNQMLSRIHTLTTSQGIENTNSGKNKAYDEQNVKYVIWLTKEDYKVCDQCKDLDKQIFIRGQAPIPQDDTHLNCRCQLVKCDEDGNVLPGELDRVFKE
ncbi:phage minor head protein [Lentilactobacillus buchneri]|uniref:phage minor head protein n=1 Tax=Lentilactobacillus buchneri TaxID=1581 RepID=UPI0028762592|nr:phage minor head protein [Lentilactobacillus buchneri]MDS1015274.1 phage minor head protein [Lentilactobacillus buchneri]